MAQPYPDPTFGTASGLWSYVDVVMGGWWGSMVMLAFTIILFMLMDKRGYSTSQSLLAAFLIPTVLGVLLWGGGLMQGKVIGIWLVLTVLSFLYSLFDS